MKNCVTFFADKLFLPYFHCFRNYELKLYLFLFSSSFCLDNKSHLLFKIKSRIKLIMFIAFYYDMLHRSSFISLILNPFLFYFICYTIHFSSIWSILLLLYSIYFYISDGKRDKIPTLIDKHRYICIVDFITFLLFHLDHHHHYQLIIDNLICLDKFYHLVDHRFLLSLSIENDLTIISSSIISGLEKYILFQVLLHGWHDVNWYLHSWYNVFNYFNPW